MDDWTAEEYEAAAIAAHYDETEEPEDAEQ